MYCDLGVLWYIIRIAVYSRTILMFANIGRKVGSIMDVKKIAKESNSSSPLMCGKALKMADIVGKELTINECDLISLPNKSGEMKPVGVVTFKEIPESYYLTDRTMMTDIIRFDKDSLTGIKVTFTSTTTRLKKCY